MAKFDLSTVTLTDYPIKGTYTYPANHDGMIDGLVSALSLPGVLVSSKPRGASWASWAGGDYTIPEHPVEVRMRVLGLSPNKKLGEVLLVSFVIVEGGAVTVVSEDHVFKPPRPAELAFVDKQGALLPITDEIRAAVDKIALPKEKKRAVKKETSEKPAKAAKPSAKPAAKPAAKSAKKK